jgi:hypothetical protein
MAVGPETGPAPANARHSRARASSRSRTIHSSIPLITQSPIPGRKPRSVQKGKILDPNGRPVSWFLYPSPRANPRANKPRPWLSPSTKVNVSSYDRKELVNYSRVLRATVDVLDAAIEAKNSWAFGDAWDAHYTGVNRKWGDEFEDIINNQWMPNCNVRGPQYSFKTSMILSGEAWDVDGDDAMILTETASHFPQLAFYPATRIDSARAGDTEVSGGAFDGSRIFDGIIFDRNSRCIGLRIVDEDGESHEDISAFNADLAYEPRWADQARGIPLVAVSLLNWMSLGEIDEFLLRGTKIASSVGLIKKTSEGEALPNEHYTEELAVSADGVTRKVGYEEIEGGESYYLSAPDGEEIEGLDYKNPHPNVEAYIARRMRGALASIGWHIELLDLTSTGRAPTRLLADLANQTIWSRQCTAYRRWKRAIAYACFKMMKHGYLSRNDDAVDALRFEPGLPKPLSVDAGNDAQADREALKLGLTTKAIITQKWHGVHFRAIDKQRELELRSTIEAATGINKDFPQLSFDRAMELLEQRSPNPIQVNAQPRNQGAGDRNPATGSRGQGKESGDKGQESGHQSTNPLIHQSPPAPRAPEQITLNIENKAPVSHRTITFQRDEDGTVQGADVTDLV